MRRVEFSPSTLLALVSLIAQTTTPAIDIGGMTSTVTGLLFAILPLVFTIAILGWVLKIVKKLPDMFAIAPLLLLVGLALLGQTSSSTDWSALTGLVLSLFAAIMPLIFIMMIFRVFGRIIESFGNIFAVRTRLARLAPLAAAALVAQTGSFDMAQQLSATLAQVLLPLLMAVVVLLVPILLVGSALDKIFSKI